MSSEDFESCLKIFCHFESIGEGVLGSDLIQVLEIFYGYQQVSSLRSPPGLLDLKKDQKMMDISLFCVFISDKRVLSHLLLVPMYLSLTLCSHL